jgi:zinc-binding in reverse transcriptase
VAQCFINGEWNVQASARLSPQGQQKMMHLQRNVPSVKPQHTDDTPCRRRHATETFSSKSAYVFLTETPYVQDNVYKIWKIKLLTRVQVFIWLMLKNKLLTIDNLMRWDWTLLNMCYLCRLNQETTYHLFEECEYTVQLREYIRDIQSPTTPPCVAFTEPDPTAKILLHTREEF